MKDKLHALALAFQYEAIPQIIDKRFFADMSIGTESYANVFAVETNLGLRDTGGA
jgi:hypothetical protein